MDPITMAAGISSLIGTGISLFGSGKANSAGQMEAETMQKEAQVSGQITGLDKQINAQRQQQMVLVNQRQQMQNIRNTQLARSMAINSAVNQGAQFGTGVAGGVGQIAAQGAQNTRDLSQNFQIGQNVFGLNNQIDDLKVKMSELGGQAAMYQGQAAQGQALANSGAAIGRLGSIGFGMFGKMGGMFGGAGGTDEVLPGGLPLGMGGIGHA